MRFTLLLLLTVILSVSKGQTVGNSTEVEKQQPIQLVFNQEDFGDKFSVFYSSDEQFDYYVVDLTKFEDRFQRVYFMILSYKEPRLVNLDGDINKDQTWFKSYYTSKETEITCLFNDLKEQTGQAATNMTAQEKSEWLNSNDKFKK